MIDKFPYTDDNLEQNYDGFEKWLASELQQNESYIENDGFTESVILALPLRHASRWVTNGLLGMAVALPIIVVVWCFPWADLLVDVTVALSAFSGVTLWEIGSLIALMFTGAGMWALNDDLL